MSEQHPDRIQATVPKRNFIAKFFLYLTKVFHLLLVIIEAFYLIFRHGMYKNPNDPKNTRYVQHFCRRLSAVFNINVQIHGEIPRTPALWVSNHISWLDIAILGAGARIFFLAKAEVASWPILGKIAAWGGTLFIKRGSGDSARVKEQISEFLKQDIPVLFFPEATTSDGSYIKKVHGKLLAAALEAGQPVQVCLISYVNAYGELDTVVPFIDDQSFADNVAQVLQMARVTAHLMALPAIDTQGHTVESLTATVQQMMTDGLASLHRQIFQK